MRLALALYLCTAISLLLAWRRLQRISVAAAIALIALPMLPAGRALLTNRTLAPADISFVAEPLHAYARDYGVEQPHNIALSDLHCQILPWQKAVRYALAHGEWPLWNPFVFAGDILAAAAQPAVYDPLQWLAMLLPLVDAFTFSVALTFFLAGFFTFAFAKELGLGDVASLVAATGFLLCGMMAFFAGWPLGRTWAYLPLVLFATRRLVHRETFALLTTAFVLVIVSGHPESVLHVVFVGAVYGLFEYLTSPRKLRPLLLALASGAIALGLTAIYLLPFFEAVPQTNEHIIRDEIYARTSYDVIAKPHVRLERMRRTFIPGVRHGDPLSARVGTILLFLAIAGLLTRRDRYAWFFLALTIAGLQATFGNWPTAHALHALPLFDVAINERLAFAAAFAMSILAAFAVDALAKRQRLLAVAVLVLVMFERTYDDGRIYPAIPREAFFPRIPLIAAIPRDARMTGVQYAFTGNNPTMYGLEDVRGYQAMTFKRFYDTYPLWSTYQHAWYNRVDDLTKPFLSFLNVRYAIGPGDAPQGWVTVAEDRGMRLFQNTSELPRAFLPTQVRFERDPERVLEGMKAATDFSHVAWIETDALPPQDILNGRGVVTLRRSGLAYELDASMEQPGWVVISATAWKGWRAYIDNRRVHTHFANHAFLGIYVPKGTHHVTLRYLPESFTRGRLISLATLVALALLGIRRGIRRGGLRRAGTAGSAGWPSR
ncbi:MAG: YfhO family protein [Acidobacteriota bacterium]|nr:YfhO family protein [Acidobacteriota bacterium]